MRCAEFEAQVSEFVDDALPTSTSAQMRVHAATCAACSALALDIAAIVSDAGVLPALTPSRDLWSGVEAGLDTPVVAIGAAARAPAHRQFFSLRMLAAAAVLLVTVSSGATYVLMHASATPTTDAPTVGVATFGVATSGVATSGVSAFGVSASGVVASGVASGAASTGADASTELNAIGDVVAKVGKRDALVVTSGRVASTVVSPGASSATGGSASSASPPGRPMRYASNAGTISERAYQREITAMRRIVDDRLGDLDSATVVEIERNLRIIDKAIDDSRRALANDPRSGFLSTQLDRALESKLGVLRRIALL